MYEHQTGADQPLDQRFVEEWLVFLTDAAARMWFPWPTW